MQKELKAIFIVFIELFILISLISYHPSDLTVQETISPDRIHNLFGFFGAYISGILIGLFGMGAFWIPILFIITCHLFMIKKNHREIITTVSGGLLLTIVTGAFFAYPQDHYVIFGNQITSGGMFGVLLKTAIVTYTGSFGGFCVLIFLLVIGLNQVLGFSFKYFIPVVNLKDRKTFIDLLIQKILYNFSVMPSSPSHQEKPMDETAVSKPSKKNIPLLPFIRQKSKKIDSVEVIDSLQSPSGFKLPPLDLLDDPDVTQSYGYSNSLDIQSRLLESKLADFGVKGQVVAVTPGPVITTFEYQPAPGVKINKIVNLSDDLALVLSAMSVRIVAPIPGKSVIGIEIPNKEREIVKLKEIIQSKKFITSKSRLTMCLGKDMVGNPVVTELDQMPHLLIAGATGSGKSVCLNTMICSFLYKSNPDQVKLIMIDPKRIELSMYDGIPHLITPVVTDVKKATSALFWAVNEMERRYELLSQKKVRNIHRYNEKLAIEARTNNETNYKRLPYIVIIIDELADLMMVASKEVEFALTRLAQMARASGIHLILATQRPSVDVLTGLIKANFPTRLSFKVSSKIDSRTIIDTNGAELLLGNGDMLFLAPGTSKLQRIHGAYISEEEVINIAEFLKNQQFPEYDHTVLESGKLEHDPKNTKHDEMYDEAVALVARTRYASISIIKRNLHIGEKRAAKILELMEKEGIIGPSDGIKPREVLIKNYN